MTTPTPKQPESKTPKDVHNAAEHPLFRGMALANVLRCLAWPYEVEWNTSEPCTLHDLNPDDLRIVLEILSGELDEAHRLLSKLPIGEIEGCGQVPASGGPSLSVTHVARMRWRPLASSDASPLATDDGSEVEVWKIGGGIMPREKRPKGERDVEARLNDIEASQWDESRMDAIVQRPDTELDEIVQRVERCLQHDVRPEHRQEFRERVRDLLDTFTDNLEDM
jgi:hypothetical protein